jgi:hypothetical protein
MNSSIESNVACDVCGKVRDAQVCASGLGPASFAYCDTCISHGAEPLNMFATAIYVAGGPAEVDPHDFENTKTFLNDQYVGLDEVLRLYPMLKAQIAAEFNP